MSKRRKQYKNKVTTVVPNVEIELSTGAVVRCMPILASIEAVRQTVEQPEKPTYEMKDAGGAVMHIPYDQAAIDDPTTSPEDKALWAKYLADSAAASRQANTRIYNRIIRRGIKIIKGGIGSGGLSKAAFTAELKEDEIDVPENKTAFHRLYVRLEIIATPDDFEAIMLGIGITGYQVGN